MAIPRSPKPPKEVGPIQQLAERRGREIEQLRAQGDADVRAAAEVIAANWRHIRGDSLTQLHEAINALEDRFADRIAALDAPAPAAAACECGCQPGQPCVCGLDDCECAGGCPVCDHDDGDGTGCTACERGRERQVT